MGFSRNQLIRAILTVVFFICMIIANFYVFRAISRIGLEIYFYDKLVVAYRFGGQKALEQELSQVLSSEGFPRELAMAKEFETKFKNTKDLEIFLGKKIEEGKARVVSLRKLRNTAIIIMFAIFLWQIIGRILERRKAS